MPSGKGNDNTPKRSNTWNKMELGEELPFSEGGDHVKGSLDIVTVGKSALSHFFGGQ